jgi:acetolactate synthase-1/2/3 large subunit
MESKTRLSVATPDEFSPAELSNVESSAVGALVRHLADLGVERAFGVSGGSIARLYDAIADSPIELHHFRHESGAAFAAAESYFASSRPAIVFSTTGPGILNALTGITAGKWDGAKMVFISGSTNPAQRGRWATQETSSYTVPQDALYSPGQFFDFAVRMEDTKEFAEVARRLWFGLSRPGGFIAHVSVPMAFQAVRVRRPRFEAQISPMTPTIADADIGRVVELLSEAPFAIWLGFGARGAARPILELAEKTKARVFSSPKGKGIFPERHPQYVGVTGLGGHSEVTSFMRRERPRWTLVLGTRLGEATSFWDPVMQPTEGFIHVDIDPQVPGVAYPEVFTIGIQADIEQFTRSLFAKMPEREEQPEITDELPTPRVHHVDISEFQDPPQQPSKQAPKLTPVPPPSQAERRMVVSPRRLMKAIQDNIIDDSDALILAECGNSFAWCNHYLKFAEPGRYRVSTLFGSMGHSAAGVVGAALGRKGKAVAVVGDGSMLMNSEISTAAQYKAQAIWIVLNDAGYGMCRDGQSTLGLATQQLDCPRVDFVSFAQALGADGIRVDDEAKLDEALQKALAADGPFIVDVQIDSAEASPLLERFESLIRQGSSTNPSGWDKEHSR